MRLSPRPGTRARADVGVIDDSSLTGFNERRRLGRDSETWPATHIERNLGARMSLCANITRRL
jgi:hypothetical protein